MYLPLPRDWSKRIAIILIVAGILLLPDIVAPTPLMDLILNVPLAMVIADVWSLSYIDAFMLTYVLAFALVATGLIIYPYNTKRLLVGKMKFAVRFIIRNPHMLIISIVVLVAVYMIGQYAYDTFYEYAKEVISNAMLG